MHRERCRRVLEQRRCAVLGLSPFNSFFTPQAIRSLVAWADARFDRVEVMLPGFEAAFGPIAAGMEPRAAVRHTLHSVRTLRGAAKTAFARVGRKPRVHTWTSKAADPHYRALYRAGADAFHRSAVFRDLCEQTVRAYLRTATGRAPSADAMARNLDYVLAEVPYLLDAAGIVGADSAVFCYPRPWPLQFALFDGRVPQLIPAHRHGFVQVTLETVPQHQESSDDDVR
ncbi:tRNA-dependent cyclodipeptide synthase [Streptomyces sp. NPDC055287]